MVTLKNFDSFLTELYKKWKSQNYEALDITFNQYATLFFSWAEGYRK